MVNSAFTPWFLRRLGRFVLAFREPLFSGDSSTVSPNVDVEQILSLFQEKISAIKEGKEEELPLSGESLLLRGVQEGEVEELASWLEGTHVTN